jgi:galactokinase
VNLIGEHTDYNQGLVLPCAIDRDTLALAAPRRDGRLRIWSSNLRQEQGFSLDAAPPPGWAGYAHALLFTLREAGVQFDGLDLAVASRVPIGAGLSSSAALGVSLAAAVSLAAGRRPEPRALADLAHRAESEVLGVGSGILDQYASALGRRDHALRIDCRSRRVRFVPLPPGRLRLLVADSGVRRALADADSGYRARVAECAEALCEARRAGVAAADATSLRDLGSLDLPRLEACLEPRLLGRVRHVLSENDRVETVCRALEAGQLSAAGEAISASHRSLRDFYQVSTPELDALCEIADELPGVYGSRLTGAGFGGCTLHLVDPGAGADVAAALADGFEQRFERRPVIYETGCGEGVSPLELVDR